MQITNTTDFDREFLRRMTSWCMRQLGHKPSWVDTIHFGNLSRRPFRGWCAWWGKGRKSNLRVLVGPASGFPWGDRGYHKARVRGGRPPERAYIDRIEALVAVTAHECEHAGQGWNGTATDELWTETETDRVLGIFRANREALLRQWSGVVIFTREPSPLYAAADAPNPPLGQIIDATG